jgi:Tetratricopeptide repeat
VEQQQGTMSLATALTQAHELSRTGRGDEAIALYEQIIEAWPRIAEVRGAMALTYWDLKRPAESEIQARAALSIDPECGSAHCALGLVEYHRLKLAEALPHFDQASRNRPDISAAFNYAGTCAEELGDDAKALAHFNAVLRLFPDNKAGHFNRSRVWLRYGWFEIGWPEFEWRWISCQMYKPAIPGPRWDGSNLKGRRILVHTEQGMGDTLQFVRLLPLLKDQGAHVSFACLKQLKPLLSRTDGIDDWLPIDEQTAVNFDVYTAIGSIPGWLRIDERTIPCKIPYVFPEPARVELWRPKIAAIGGFKVGLCWQGSKEFTRDVFRSIPLQHYAPLAHVQGVTLISLQKGYGEEQIAENRSRVPITVLEHLDAEGGAMMDTAAVMQHLDLVITSDTAIAHLAGSMGIPVWVALSTASDWRWLRRRSDSPWYPSMRLFRQKNLGEWDPIFAEIAEALRQLIAGTMPVVTAPASNNSVAVPATPGELFDEIAILRIKSERMNDVNKLANVNRELSQLESVQAAAYPPTPELSELAAELKRVNEELWEIEDAIRDCERNMDFSQKFIDLARSVYRVNDRRAETKRKINELLGTTIQEVKSYSAY